MTLWSRMVVLLCLGNLVGCSSTRSLPTIVFDSDRDGSTELYAVAPDGTGVRPLADVADPTVFSRLPNWSPDCRQIAFQSNRNDPDNSDLYIMAADGTDLRRLTSHPAVDESPAWSPDGRRLAFSSSRKQPETIYVVNADGTGLHPLTDGPAFYPSWSPNGSQVAFIGGTPDNWDIGVVGLDGTGRRWLTRTPARHEHGVAWSPDGTLLAFDGLTDGAWDIFTMEADGTRVRPLTTTPGVDARPAWSPDGQHLVFHSTRESGSDGDTDAWHEFELYVMRADGTAPRRLTTNTAFDAHPDWCGAQ